MAGANRGLVSAACVFLKGMIAAVLLVGLAGPASAAGLDGTKLTWPWALPFAGLLMIYLHHNLSALKFLNLPLEQLKEALPINATFFSHATGVQLDWVSPLATWAAE